MPELAPLPLLGPPPAVPVQDDDFACIARRARRRTATRTGVLGGTAALTALAIAFAAATSAGPDPARLAVASPTATAPAPAWSAAPSGHSDVTISGEVSRRTTVDLQCSYAIDDFFVRGRLGDYQGIPLYVSMNVEFYKKPGTYPRQTQVLLRRVSSDNRFYASWYSGRATMTVLPGGRGAHLEPVTLQPEPGSESTKPVTIAGDFACARG